MKKTGGKQKNKNPLRLLLPVLGVLVLLFGAGLKATDVNLLWERNFRYIYTLYVDTENGVTPGFTPVYHPEGCEGASIINNEYVPAVLKLSVGGNPIYLGSTQIRVRGNTSAANSMGKLPYRLKLDSPADLLCRGDEGHAYRNWVLLDGSDLHTMYGLYVSSLCGMVWEPDCRFVNLVLNGKWLGTYLLTEQVEVTDDRVEMEKDGVLAEYDAYWWKPDTTWVRTSDMDMIFGITFKYPSGKGMTEGLLRALSERLEQVDRTAVENPGNLSALTDYDSLARWLLIQDYMGMRDCAGANFYFVIPSFSEESKISAGPCWDFDSAFDNRDKYSSVHDSMGFGIFPILLSQEEFCGCYRAAWEEVREQFVTGTEDFLNRLKAETGGELDLSWKIDHLRWHQDECSSFAQQRELLTQWAAERSAWLEDNLDTLQNDCLTVRKTDGEELLLTLRTVEEYERVMFPVWSRENGQDDMVWYTGTYEEDTGLWSVQFSPAEQGQTDFGPYSVEAYGYNGEVPLYLASLLYNLLPAGETGAEYHLAR